MPINFRAMRTANDKKAALNAIVDCISDADHKREVKAVLTGQKIQQVTNLMLQRP